MQQLTHFSLFTGIGGIDLAAEWAGFQSVGQCEWADYPTKVLEKHWPEVPRWRDIRDVTKQSCYDRGLRTVDLITGGFPCQPFSTAGKRKGKDDDRYLWPEMFRVISELKPTWVLGENVAGLISMAESIGKAKVEHKAISRLPDEDVFYSIYTQEEIMLIERILQDLEAEGYEVQPFIIPACAVDARHRRDRTFIVAHNASERNWSISIQSGRSQQTGFNTNRSCKNVSYSNEIRCDMRRLKGEGIQRENTTCNETYSSSKDVCHTSGQGLQDRTTIQMGKSRSIEESKRSNWWAVEPDVGRVANGIPNRVDRLKCLGNAVVPQQVYPILKAIHDIEMGIA